MARSELTGRDSLAWRRGKPWPLLERDEALEALSTAARDAAGGSGRLVFVLGEAGIGKSAVLRQFSSMHPGYRVVTGACEPLAAPEPLGPLFDIAPSLGPKVQSQLEGGAGRTELFASVIQALQSSPALPVLFIEDVHWADHATLDFLRYLGRRAERVRALTVATFREEEAGSSSPLSILLGDLATAAGVDQLPLAPLSENATRILAAGTDANASELHRLSGGNPFFITEVLAAGATGVPASIRDAVLARIARLAEPTRAAIEAAAAIGPRCSSELFAALLDALDVPRWTMRAVIFTGFMRQNGTEFEFRHALAQSAITETTAVERLQTLHQHILQILLKQAPAADGYTAVIAHAQAAGADETVAKYALPAAARAAALGAHREAASLYGLALEYDGPLPAARQAELWELQGEQLSQANEVNSALDRYRKAAGLLQEDEDQLNRGRVFSQIAALTYFTGRHEEAEAAESEALRCLESQPPCRELAIAYQSRAHRMFIAVNNAETKHWAERARAIALQSGDREIELEARMMTGAAELMEGNDAGRIELEECLSQATERGRAELGARITFYLAWLRLLNRDLADIDRHLDTGLALCEEHDLGYWRLMLLSVNARLRFQQARWAETDQIEAAAGARHSLVPPARLPTLAMLGRLAARRGRGDAFVYLDDASEVARAHPKLESLSSALPARAEAAWLAGDCDRARQEAESALSAGFGADNPWWMGELRCLLHRVGATPLPDGPTAEPYQLEIDGDLEASAGWWERHGCVYEAAMAGALSDECEAVAEALLTFDQLGAAPAAALARNRLRSMGVAAIPRGPRPSTSAHPAGLTRREQEVLELVAAGLTNAQISSRLFLSPKTVERHVSSLMGKLGAASRSEAVTAARALGALPQAQPAGTSLPN